MVMILLINCRGDKIFKSLNVLKNYKEYIIFFASFLLALFKCLSYN